ncbi:alpha-N-acetylgalactosaminide alpha-2,6-sialyltransferase 1-like isoform X1 [Ambystoma mexicanum]|uniref:alpha-N-acetylgalactosaminide alpha-2,6-sialyltransferase 1-like isoform X1 n=1 Tax=Ambystoma mexicanum TaxID=8296 RepID=UPI0037E88158
MFPCGRLRVRKLFTGLLVSFTLVFLTMLILKRYDGLTAQLPRSQKPVMEMSERTALNEKDARAPEGDLTLAVKEQISEIKEEKKQEEEKHGGEDDKGEIVGIMEEEKVREKTRVAPTINKEEPPVKKEMEKATVKKEEAPAKKKEEAPVKKEEETQVKKEEPLVKKEETPVKKEEPPVKKEEETPVKKEEPLVKKEETPVKKEEPLVKKEEETPVKNEEPPVKKEAETSVKKEVSLVKKEEETPVKKEEAESKKESQNMAPPSAIKAPETQKGQQAASHVITDTGKAKTIMPVPTLRTPVLSIIPPGLDPSYIGDVYSQQENPFQTTDCPSSIRKKMMGTDFRRIFLKDVPVLQWKPHATVEEYARLRGYNGCFGWNLTSWDDIKETLALLNTSANGYIFSDWNRNRSSASPCIRCAAVGNGGILNGSKMGKEIDQHDYVFRVNGAILQGYEEDVGNHTSFYVFSTNTMMNSLISYGPDGFRKIPQLQDTSYIFIPDNDRDFYMVKAALMRSPVDRGGDMKKLPSDFFGQNYTTEQFKVFHPDFLRYLRNRFLLSELLRTEYANIYRPSTGASMLLAAVHSCDEVSAYGFITPDYEKYSDHYFDKSKKEVMFYVNHDYSIEIDLWQRLHNQGIIKLYSRS